MPRRCERGLDAGPDARLRGVPAPAGGGGDREALAIEFPGKAGVGFKDPPDLAGDHEVLADDVAAEPRTDAGLGEPEPVVRCRVEVAGAGIVGRLQRRLRGGLVHRPVEVAQGRRAESEVPPGIRVAETEADQGLAHHCCSPAGSWANDQTSGIPLSSPE